MKKKKKRKLVKRYTAREVNEHMELIAQRAYNQGFNNGVLLARQQLRNSMGIY